MSGMKCLRNSMELSLSEQDAIIKCWNTLLDQMEGDQMNHDLYVAHDLMSPIVKRIFESRKNIQND